MRGRWGSLTSLQTAEYDGFHAFPPFLVNQNIAMSINTRWLFSVCAALLLWPAGAAAQGLETMGSRAAALSAFVAVADDASATVWNPSGLVTGPFANIVLDLGGAGSEPDDPPESPQRAGRTRSTLVAIGTTPVGLAYYRLGVRTITAVGPAVVGTPDRQDRRVLVRHLVTHHFGATVQQSVTDWLTLGATLKVVRGRLESGEARVQSWAEAFDRAAGVGASATRGDLDVGAMASAGQLRVGLLVRNLTEPSFGTADDEMALTRHVRVGAAWGDRWPGTPRTIVALDADLTEVPHPAGPRRDVAAGVERWWRGQQVGVRGGVRASTVGERRPVVSAGTSYALRAGAYLDVYAAAGTGAARAWGVAVRVGY